MPNHIKNELRFFGEQDRIDKLLESIKGKETIIDFNKIIPMPASLNIESCAQTDRGLEAYRDFIKMYTTNGTVEKDLLNIPKEKEKEFLIAHSDIDCEVWEIGRTAFQNEQKYGYSTWYRWCIVNWGSKWNAWDTDLIGKNSIVFTTAWSDVPKVIRKISENFPDIQINYRWADEDLGANVGIVEFYKGEIVSEQYFRTLSKKAFEQAADIWGIDLYEEGYVFNEESGTYEWNDE